jgi:hypothetical protein
MVPFDLNVADFPLGFEIGELLRGGWRNGEKAGGEEYAQKSPRAGFFAR